MKVYIIYKICLIYTAKFKFIAQNLQRLETDYKWSKKMYLSISFYILPTNEKQITVTTVKRTKLVRRFVIGSFVCSVKLIQN